MPLTKRSAIFLALLGGLTVCLPVTAQNWRFLKDAPITFFTQKDVEMFKANLRDTLDDGKDGERHSWSNKASGAAGSAIAQETLHRGKDVCRRVRLDNIARGRSGFTQKTFCKHAGKDWQLRP